MRGSTPAPGPDFERYGGHTTCVALSPESSETPTLILDAGTGLRVVGELLGEQPFLGTILLTHLHWDHTQGLPFFKAGDRPDSRVALILPEQQNGKGPVEVLSRAMSPPFFPIGPDDLRGSWSFSEMAPGASQLGGFEVLAREIPHKGGRTFGYRISDGRSTITFMPDHCPWALGPGPDGYGEYHDAALALARDSDLLIHDAQLLREELSAEAMTGHSCGEYAVELARRAGARAVLLFHHRPDRTDAALEELTGRFEGEEPPVTLARQGATLRL
ncbi:MAG: MBL fold metallo-hydrolase [Solirubrobacteraceae bacterium]